MKKFTILLILSSLILSACGLYKRSDIKDNPVEVGKRVERNVAEGRGIRFGSFGGDKSGGIFDFASSNPMWQATMNILDFVTFANASYSGGIIITDWFNDEASKENIRDLKITVKFLSNEIRADGIQVDVHERICKLNLPNSCKINKIQSTISSELKLAILKKAARIEKNIIVKRVKKNKRVVPKRDKKN
tara:strand:- start:661 stop:1230 length:570 start_codon:yes stop_codon:yes gene_type:complete